MVLTSGHPPEQIKLESPAHRGGGRALSLRSEATLGLLLIKLQPHSRGRRTCQPWGALGSLVAGSQTPPSALAGVVISVARGLLLRPQPRSAAKGAHIYPGASLNPCSRSPGTLVAPAAPALGGHL